MAPERPWRPGDPASDWREVPGRRSLRSVRACERQDWHLLLWPRAGPGTDSGGPVLSPFFCGSWRCKRCARWRGAIDFERCRKGLARHSTWFFAVLTVDPSQFENDPYVAMRQVGMLWDRDLRRRWARIIGKFTYLQTWEAFTKSRFPHLNIVFRVDDTPGLLEKWGTRPGTTQTNRGTTRETEEAPALRRALRRAAMQAGFGRVFWLEVLRERSESMAAYFLKLARELTGAVMEAEGKGAQAPIDAPPHFRRIRATRGLLPPAVADGDGTFTGSLTIGRTGIQRDTDGPRKPGDKPVTDPAAWDDVLRNYVFKGATMISQLTDTEKIASGFFHEKQLLRVLCPEWAVSMLDERGYFEERHSPFPSLVDEKNAEP